MQLVQGGEQIQIEAVIITPHGFWRLLKYLMYYQSEDFRPH